MHDVWLHPTDKTSLMLFIFTTMATRYSTLTLCNYLRIVNAVGEHTLYRKASVGEREGGKGQRKGKEGSEREEGGERETRREEGKEVFASRFCSQHKIIVCFRKRNTHY